MVAPLVPNPVRYCPKCGGHIHDMVIPGHGRCARCSPGVELGPLAKLALLALVIVIMIIAFLA